MTRAQVIKMLQKPEQTALKIIRNLVREQRIAELYNGDILAIDELCKVNGKMDMAIWVLAQFADKVKPLAHYPATYPSQLFFLKQNMGYEVVVLLAGEEHLARLLPASTEVKYIFVVESVEMITRIPLPEATCLFATVEHQEHGEPLVHFYSEGKDG
jgi:hypothetical protein